LVLEGDEMNFPSVEAAAMSVSVKSIKEGLEVDFQEVPIQTGSFNPHALEHDNAAS
jgi:hypothetical protein